MEVWQLIEQLKKCDPNTQVFVQYELSKRLCPHSVLDYSSVGEVLIESSSCQKLSNRICSFTCLDCGEKLKANIFEDDSLPFSRSINQDFHPNKDEE